MSTHDRSSDKSQNDQHTKPSIKVASYVAPKIQKTQKLVEVTGMAISGFVPLPPT